MNTLTIDYIKKYPEIFEIIPDTYNRHIKIYKNKDLVGYMWFKNMLGGWRVGFNDDNEKNNWQTREPINTVDQLKLQVNWL